MNIILCGYKTSGKSTLAQAYSKAYACEYIDTDRLLIDLYKKNNGVQKTIGEIYQEYGGFEFRKLEFKALQLVKNIDDAIIAIGGGTVLNAACVSYLKTLGSIFYLNVSKKILANRLAKLKVRPSFINNIAADDDIKRYLYSRDENYLTVADYVINPNGKSIKELVSILYQYRCDYGQ
ncbi:MAG: hypothetical protein A3E88_07655 [Legionellales bacterium RIFCSPHIGHO2_12_FULL_35_11]|nr:MAG: hypothetical protein A3E88_07655 [Legionellales bacterium RIFCSPHIGHO2_12_FULL_35_11]